MALKASEVTWESIKAGDALPQVVKEETQETIDEYWRLAQDRREGWKSLHMNEEYSKTTIFGSNVNMGVATMGYFSEMLHEAFPVKSILGVGGHLEVKAMNPIHAGDTVTLNGKVSDKREEDGKRYVDVEYSAINQLGITVAVGKATVTF